MFRMREKEQDLINVIYNARRGTCAWRDNSEQLTTGRLNTVSQQMVEEKNRTQGEIEIEGIQNEADFINLIPR
jgi:hypothetical protein